MNWSRKKQNTKLHTFGSACLQGQAGSTIFYSLATGRCFQGDALLLKAIRWHLRPALQHATRWQISQTPLEVSRGIPNTAGICLNTICSHAESTCWYLAKLQPCNCREDLSEKGREGKFLPVGCGIILGIIFGGISFFYGFKWQVEGNQASPLQYQPETEPQQDPTVAPTTSLTATKTARPQDPKGTKPLPYSTPPIWEVKSPDSYRTTITVWVEIGGKIVVVVVAVAIELKWALLRIFVTGVAFGCNV